MAPGAIIEESMGDRLRVYSARWETSTCTGQSAVMLCSWEVD